MHKYLVLVGDPDSGEWTTAVQSTNKELASEELDALKEDGTPTILIFTGDYVTV